jgi:hypothetical protein
MERLKAVAGEALEPSALDVLKQKLAKLGKSDKKTTSGSEAPPEAGEPDVPGAVDTSAGSRPLTGADVDWSEYQLDFNVAHLYKKAVLRDTPEGPKWIAMVVDFLSVTRDFNNHGKFVKQVGNPALQEPLNLGEFLKDRVNGRDQWRIAAVMPAGSQCGLLLEREVPVVLPDPEPLKKKEEVEAPTDKQLQNVEDAALTFMAEQKEVDKVPAVEDDNGSPEPVSLRPIERGTPEHEQAVAQLDENGGLQARAGAGVSRALATARAEEVPAPQGPQPEAVENPLLGGEKVPAAGYSAAQDILRALSDPNFRKSLPRE